MLNKEELKAFCNRVGGMVALMEGSDYD